MKEAAGEANMTVVTIVLIAIVLGVGTLIINGLMSGTAEKSCEAGGGTWNAEATNADGSKGKCDY